jgi:hypothetical protein
MPDLETPDEDAAEQQQSVTAEESEVPATPRWDADEGDLAESSLEVPLDDDDYR